MHIRRGWKGYIRRQYMKEIMKKESNFGGVVIVIFHFAFLIY